MDINNSTGSYPTTVYHQQQQIRSGLENRLLDYGSIYWLIRAHEKSGMRTLPKQNDDWFSLLENLSAKYKESVPIGDESWCWKRHKSQVTEMAVAERETECAEVVNAFKFRVQMSWLSRNQKIPSSRARERSWVIILARDCLTKEWQVNVGGKMTLVPKSSNSQTIFLSIEVQNISVTRLAKIPLVLFSIYIFTTNPHYLKF